MTMISLEDSPWSRSYSVWSQLAVELPLLMGGGPAQPKTGPDAESAERRADDGADHAKASPAFA